MKAAIYNSRNQQHFENEARVNINNINIGLQIQAVLNRFVNGKQKIASSEKRYLSRPAIYLSYTKK